MKPRSAFLWGCIGGVAPEVLRWFKIFSTGKLMIARMTLPKGDRRTGFSLPQPRNQDNPLTDADRCALTLSQIVHKRLTYAELTGKAQRRPEAF
jgi:hypothetical protein